jgi:hypothetical protein
MLNPLALAQDVDVALFAIRRGDHTDAERASLVNGLFAMLEGSLIAATAEGNDQEALAWRNAIDHLKSKVENVR